MKYLRLFPIFALLLCTQLASAKAIQSDSLHFGVFGKVHIYQTTNNPDQVVLFISGDGGWNEGVVDMAKELARQNAMVLGIDINTLFHNMMKINRKCLYPAGDFQELAQYVQRKEGLPEYHIPVLAGYSSGATMVYVLLAEAPINTFAGGISLGFSPDLDFPKPFCRGALLRSKLKKNKKGYLFTPVTRLDLPWIVLQGNIDKVSDPTLTKKFVKNVTDAKLVILPGVGHGYSVPKNWVPEFINAYKEITTHERANPQSSVARVKDLPLEEVPATGPQNDVMCVLISGDGGWASIDQGLSKTLAQSGIPTVGINSLKYLWNRKTPQQAAIDLQRVTQNYLLKWHKKKVIFIGYSLGADILPFMLHNLPEPLSKNTLLAAFLSPSQTVDFQFHLSYWIGGGSGKNYLNVLPAIQSLKKIPLLCLYGDDETDSICKDISMSNANVVAMSGGHHFDGDYRGLADEILKYVKKSSE